MTPPTPDLSQQLLDSVFQSLGLHESIYRLFRFLLDHIPSDRIVCYAIDRPRKIMNTLIDYNTSMRNSPRTQELSRIFDMDYLYTLMDDDFTFLQNDVQESENGIPEYVLRNFNAPYRATLGVYLDIDARGDSLFTVMLASFRPNAYTEEHRAALVHFRPVLQQLLGRFFRSEKEPGLILTDEGPLHATSEALLRRCPGLAQVMRRVDIVAPGKSTVMLRGASGTGKELVAETIHSLSPRADAPLIKVNCGAIPPTLIDSTLFGHERGAFTGAVSAHPGFFEQARGGTLYLDEIGELDLPSQARLLRVLETMEIRRVGGSRLLPVDVRIIAATHRDLWSMVREGGFREDLWYRLNVYPIEIPSLNQRQEDIPVLAEHFYKFYAREQELDISPRLTRRFILELATRDWPGNVRQLRHVMERAMLESSAEGAAELRLADMDRQSAPAGDPRKARLSRKLDMAREVESALERSGGRIQGRDGAAALLGLSPSTLRSRMKVLGIPLPRQRRKRES